MIVSIVLLTGLVLTCLAVFAMPPDALEVARRAATDAVRMEVTQIRQTLEAPPESNRWVRVEVHATVLGVTRSKHGLAPGDSIVIRWTLHSPRNRAVGDFPPLVEVDGTYDACLDFAPHEGHYVPAAFSMSFIPVE